MDAEIKGKIRRQFFKHSRYAILLWLVIVYMFSLYLAGPNMKKIALSSFMAGFFMFGQLFLLVFANWLVRIKQGTLFFSLQILTTIVMALMITDHTARSSWLVGFVPVLIIEEMALSGQIERHFSPLFLMYTTVILILGITDHSLGHLFLLLEAIVAIWFIARYYYTTTYMRIFQSIQLKQVNNELNEAYHEVARLTAEAIRQKMARELHDTITQDLVGINLQLTAVKMYLDSNQLAQATTKLDLVQKMTQTAITESRETITKYRQLPDQQMTTSLKYKLLEKTQLLQAKYNLQTTLVVPEEIKLGGELLIDVIRMVNEALMNVIKHADTDQAKVSAHIVNDRLVIAVYNNGKVFVNAPSYRRGHYGLIGMRERAQQHGGDLKILSTPDEGTTVMIEVKICGHEND
ncbi:sensor histidine kinase [Loigolactobacillus binensis]|uniref:histidine kinase n=1 Tax=Loigolactobacillus binensis TaxID=2559922 RepID=A0ABW3EGZ1_9LACO|nr:sensor histidine kinase [Loigolactobacillus binensis]